MSAACLLLAACFAAPPAAWPTERVEMVDGRQYRGLVESQDDLWLNFVEIAQPAGRPIHLVVRPLPRRLVAAVERLGDAEAASLRERIAAVRQRARVESARIEAVVLTTAAADGVERHRYAGAWFQLESQTDELTSRRIVVRLEQAFTAFRQLLPPQTRPDAPPRICVYGSTADYRRHLAELGIAVDNLACYVRERNLVLAGSELGPLAAEVAKLDLAHRRLRRELKDLEDRLPERLRAYAVQLQHDVPKSDVARLLTLEKARAARELAEHQRQLAALDRRNAQEFEKAAGALMARLCHEAFHAWMDDYVFPARRYDVPAWLAEGLAMLAEAARLDAGVLRIDALHRQSLRQLQTAANGPTLDELLSAGPRAFHQSAGGAAADFYASAWALTHYLAFDRGVLAVDRLRPLIVGGGSDAERRERFVRLVGQPLAAFEVQWRAWIGSRPTT